MTTTIDNKIVEMAFQNSQFEKNVSTSLGTLDKLKRALNFGNVSKSFDGITDGARRVNMNPIADGISAISNRFSALGIVGIGVLLNLTNAALEAGKRIVNALIIDPIKTGLNEYETKLNSVQTILANTQKEGTNLETVTKALNDLNTYSDKTIYNFQQMARNIGTFTAAGVKLDTSVAAIKGIANLAAISGSNADQASTAMYQLSQALSTGTVRLMDWNSVVNAGMGGQVFQDAVMETARVHGVAIDQIIAEEGSFRDSLQRGWFSSEILTETLQKFTGDLNEEQLRTMGYTEDQIAGIIKMGQTANDAATKVKTFSQLMQTLAEASQSGWAQTWEIIIGDFEEAKSFLTDLNNFFGGLIGRSADARNELLKGWSDLGGRTKLIEAFQNAINAVITALNPIRDAMREIFPPITAQNLMRITEAVAAFTKRLILTPKAAEEVRRIFRGVFAVLDIGKTAVIAIGKEFGRLLGYLSPVPGGLTAILAKFGDWLVKVRDMIKTNDTFGKIMRTIGDTILLVSGVIAKAIESIVTAVKRFVELRSTEGTFKAIQGAIQAFLDYFKTLDLDILKGFVERITTRFAPLTKLGDLIKGALDRPEKETNPFVEKLKKIGENIRKAIGEFILNILDKIANIDFSKTDFKSVFDSLNAGLLGALLIAITRFVNKGTGIFGSIVDVFKGISGFAENANGILASITTVMTGVKDILTAWQQQVRAGILMKIAGAIAILAGSLLVLSLIDSEKLTIALGAVTALFADLIGALAIYEKLSGGAAGLPAMAKAIGAMLGLSSSILLLSVALKKISDIPSGDIIKGITAIAALSAVMVTTSLVLSKNQAGAIKGAGSMIIFSLALRSLIGPVKTLGSMDTGAMAQGLVGLGVMLTEVTLFMKTMNKSVLNLDDIIGLLVLSGAITTLSKVIEQLGRLEAATLTQGLTVLGILLTGLAGFTTIAKGGGLFLATAAGMLVLSGAMVIISKVLKEIGSMSMDEITVALIGLAGSLGILGIAMTAMQGSILGVGAILIAAAALAILVPPLKALGNMSLEQVGIALLALAGVFTILGIAGAVLTPVVPTLIGLAGAVAALGAAVLLAGVGVAAFASGLALLATVGAAGGGAVAAALLAIATVLPLLAAAAALAIIAFARVIKEGVPTIFEAGKALMLGFIKSITETMPEIVNMILTGIDTFLAAVAEKAPSIIQSGYDILLGLLSGVRDNIGQVVTVSGEIITAYLTALSKQLPSIIDSGYKLIISFIDGLTAAVDQHLPTIIDSVQELGIAIVKGLVKGLFESSENARDAVLELGQIVIDQFKKVLGIASPSTVFTTLAIEIVNGLVNGLKTNSQKVVTEVINIAKRMLDNFKGNVTSFYNVGTDLVQGLANGVKNYISVAVDAAAKLAQAVLERISSVFDSHSPSRVMIDQGKFLNQGLAGGITKFSGLVTSAVSNLGNDTISGFSGVISKITEAVNNNLDANPTIRPVVDLSNIESSGTKIDKLFGGQTLSFASAASVSASIAANQANQSAIPAVANNEPAVVSFTQNNYSPKELSRIDIYRQTKNLLSQKGAVATK